MSAIISPILLSPSRFSNSCDNSPVKNIAAMTCEGMIRVIQHFFPDYATKLTSAREAGALMGDLKDRHALTESGQKRDEEEIAELEERFQTCDQNKFLLLAEKEGVQTIIVRTNNFDVHLGATENRPCHHGLSQVHMLECGHGFYSKNPTSCGHNCRKANRTTGQGHHCILCYRIRYLREFRDSIDYWHDLLHPYYVWPVKDKAQIALVSDRWHTGEPAYLGCSDCIILPRTNFEIALIRVFEGQKEDFARDFVQSACIMHGYDSNPNIPEEALAHFATLLKHYHLLKQMDVRLVVVAVVGTAGKLNGRKCNTNSLIGKIHAPWREDFDLLYEYASIIVTNCAAASILDKFNEKLLEDLHMKPGFREVEQAAIRIWIMLGQRSVLSLRDKWQNREVIVAACIEQSMACVGIPFSFKDVSKTLDFIPDKWAVTEFQYKVKKFAQGYDWTQTLRRLREEDAGTLPKGQGPDLARIQESSKPVVDIDIELEAAGGQYAMTFHGL